MEGKADFAINCNAAIRERQVSDNNREARAVSLGRKHSLAN